MNNRLKVKKGHGHFDQKWPLCLTYRSHQITGTFPNNGTNNEDNNGAIMATLKDPAAPSQPGCFVGFLWFDQNGVVLILLLSLLMPQVPLRRKFLQELDDIDQSHKRARLSKYIHDVVNVHVLTSDGEATSNTSNTSSISSISSISSLSSDSDSDTALSLTPSEIMEYGLAILEEEIHKLREEISPSRVARRATTRKRKAHKPSQMSKVTHSILAISVRALTYPSTRPLHLSCSCLAHRSTPCSVSVHFCDQHPPD